MVPALARLCAILLLVSCGNDWNQFETPASDTSAILKKQVELYASLASECAEGSRCEGQLLLERNRQLEKLSFMSLDKAVDLDEVDRKYDLLAKVSGLEGLPDGVELGEPDGDDYYRYPKQFVYHPKVIAEVAKVFSDYGPMYIDETPVVGKRHALFSFESEVRPWTGYWHPISSKFLAGSSNSVLAKLDRALGIAYGVRSNIHGEELKRFTGYRPYGWEGRCDGLAFASVLVPEPHAPVLLGEQKFSIEAQKGIHVLAHMNVDYKQYGITYRGDSTTDGTYQDLKPEALHQLAWMQLGLYRQAFVVDDTARPEVWNKALFRYAWRAKYDESASIDGFADAYIVDANPWLIKQRSSPSDELTSQKDVLSVNLKYRLYVDKSSKNQNGYRVIAGQWLGDSKEKHFGNAKVVDKNTQPNSTNDQLNRYMNFVNKGFFFRRGVDF